MSEKDDMLIYDEDDSVKFIQITSSGNKGKFSNDE